MYFDIFHDQAIGSNLRFRNPENILEGEDIRVRPTLGSGFSRYQGNGKLLGFLSRYK